MRNYFTQGTIKRMRSYERSELNSAQVFGTTDILYETNSLIGSKKNNPSYLKNLGRLIFVFCISLFSLNVSAQVTEHFSDEVTGASSFTNSGYTFNLTGGRFVIANFATYGWTGSAKDDYYVDNYGNYPSAAGVLGSITSSTL